MCGVGGQEFFGTIQRFGAVVRATRTKMVSAWPIGARLELLARSCHGASRVSLRMVLGDKVVLPERCPRAQVGGEVGRASAL